MATEKSYLHSKREEIHRLVDEIFPEIDETQVEAGQEFFSEAEVLEETTQFVNFQIGNEFYAVDISYVLEIIKVPKISYLPSAGENIRGLINLRGNIIPVINIHKLFGIANLLTPDKSSIMIISVEKSNLGFMVDSVSHVIELKREDIDQPMVTLDMEKTAYIIGEANIDGQLVAILDICKLVKNEIFIAH